MSSWSCSGHDDETTSKSMRVRYVANDLLATCSTCNANLACLTLWPEQLLIRLDLNQDRSDCNTRFCLFTVLLPITGLQNMRDPVTSELFELQVMVAQLHAQVAFCMLFVDQRRSMVPILVQSAATLVLCSLDDKPV